MLEASTFLSTLIGEFAGKSSSNYSMALEFHKRAHMDFGSDWLDQSLQMCMQALSQIVNYCTSIYNSSAPAPSLDKLQTELATSVVQLTIDIIGWDFIDAWDSSIMGMSVLARTVIRPPDTWREYLMHPEFIKAVFHLHHLVVHTQGQQVLGHSLRQLLLLLASVHGPMFKSIDERKAFANFLMEGVLGLLSDATSAAAQESSSLLDTFAMISRLIVNYKMSILIQLPQMNQLFTNMAMIGKHLLQENLKECESVHGDVECMEHREWREEALTLLLEGIVLVCGDPCLLYSGDEAQRTAASAALASTLGPLYAEFIHCRTGMARLEEQYLTAHETELDELKEEIFAVDLEEEMASLSNVGRLNLGAALACLSASFQKIVPQLQALWNGAAGGVSPEAAGLLEESRLLTMYIGHLLTDDNEGESPQVPDFVVNACERDPSVTNSIVQAVSTLNQFAQFQVTKIAANPSDLRLSPLLAKSFLWFLNRWAPAYILPLGYSELTNKSPILAAWSSAEKIQEAVYFCLTLSLHYHCYWPHEGQVQESATALLFSLAKRCTKMRLAMVSSPSFQQLCQFHCVTSGIRHSAPPEEVEATVQAKAGGANLSLDMLRGYQRLPYDIKSKIVTGLIVACSEKDDAQSNAMLNEIFKAIHDVFSSLVHVLSTRQATPDQVDAKEMTSLCVELYGGVARTGEMVEPNRIPKFLTPSLSHLSGLMAFYANDLIICEGLLRFFRDYAEQFIAILDPEDCLALFQSSADLLKAYSSVHCASTRVIKNDVEEEQNYTDVLCAIQLLIQLGTKDFLDVGKDGAINSSQVTEMIFFGLQQILPLMTRGLLQFPTLCKQYFSLVGFMMETYPDEVGQLPFELFDALLESLLFGMSYHDPSVAKASFYGISGILKEQIQNKVLDMHLSSPQGPALIEKCSRRLLMDVVFQNIIWDRIEATGAALLSLAALDLNRFAAVVQSIAQQMPAENQQRLSHSFQVLLKPEILAKAGSPGYEGRQNRIRFRKDFEDFCNEIHSFLLMR
ncbi:unnamed protein product [Cylindrotheca closterium]|uniref:Exportin-1 C-terminal domain-containing protein n=1 Tax=Cylindrotheca closterium TaxID=2856 RepID=A0AAD2CRW6_9STRA|nr:unnamed protein product [Cylindrotheca closterium]